MTRRYPDLTDWHDPGVGRWDPQRDPTVAGDRSTDVPQGSDRPAGPALVPPWTPRWWLAVGVMLWVVVIVVPALSIAYHPAYYLGKLWGWW